MFRKNSHRTFALTTYKLSQVHLNSSSLGPGTKWFTCLKWFIGYNFGINNGAESKFGTHKELNALNILKCKYCVNKSFDMSRDRFSKNRKFLLNNWWPV